MCNYIFLPKFSAKPNKIVLFNEVSRYGSSDKKKGVESISNEKTNLTRKFHNFNITPTAQKNLREKISWLYQLSKSRFVITYSGKQITNFKINFLTLTLPAKQAHPTSQITNECLNQFLSEIRQRTKMENYVWRLEFQHNGNVHYHVVTDTYIDYFFAQKIWNRILSKLGYIDAFASKMKKLSAYDYFLEYGEKRKQTFEESHKSYVKGRSEGWRNPPSVDVKSCTSNKHIGLYISKYFSKKKDGNPICNALDNEDNSFGLRLWFCSRSLSKLKGIVDYVEAVEFNPADAIKSLDKTRKYFHKYATCYYFEWADLSNYIKSILFPYFYNYAKSLGYCPAYIGTS
jgi:hypothetical protein